MNEFDPFPWEQKAPTGSGIKIIKKRRTPGNAGGGPSGPGFGISTPTLTLVSGAAVTKPKFDIDLAAPTVGDIIELRRSSSPTMSSPTLYSHTLTAVTACFGAMDFAVGAEVDGTSYWQARHRRGSLSSDWTPAQTVVVASVSVPGVPGTLDPRGFPQATFDAGFNWNTIHFTDVQFNGPEHASRCLLVGYGAQLNSANTYCRLVTDIDLASGNPAGTLCDISASSVWGANRHTEIFAVSIPTGAFGRLVVAGANFACCVIASVLGYTFNKTPTATNAFFDGVDGVGAPADDLVAAGSVTIPANGFALSFVTNAGNPGSTFTWKNSYAAIAGNGSGANLEYSFAKSSAAGASLAQVTRGSFQSSTLVVAAFGP